MVGSASQRINLITGCIDQSTGGGWQRLSTSEGKCATAEQVDQRAVAAKKLTHDRMLSFSLVQYMLKPDATGSVNSSDQFEVRLYNGSECDLTGMTVTVNDRKYTWESSMFKSAVSPHAVGTLTFSVLDVDRLQRGDYKWDISKADFITPGSTDGDTSCMDLPAAAK